MIRITFGCILGAPRSKEPQRRFCLGQRPYVAKLLFIIRLRCASGVPFRPADLTRRHSSPPPEVPREMALVRKTGRQGYFRQRSNVSPSACVPHVPSAAATDTCAAAPPLTGGTPAQNGRWKVPPGRPIHRAGSFHRDALQYGRRRGVSWLATTRHGSELELFPPISFQACSVEGASGSWHIPSCAVPWTFEGAA